jgi:pimeloyl-ACP methyl ester carboxylesterase
MPLDPPGELSSTDVGGRTIAYRRRGSGPPLVLLHGFIVDSHIWRPQLEGLADRFTVIAWDAPGAGASDDPPPDFGIADWADALAGFLAARSIDRAHVAGLSWGGLLAQELYRRHPSLVGSLVLADSYAGWKGSLGDRVARERLEAALRDAELTSDEFTSRYLPGMFSAAAPAAVRKEMADLMRGWHPVGFRLMSRAVASADTRSFLSTISVPTLLIWGDADARSPLAVGEDFHRRIPGSRLVVLPDAGHVSNLEQPEAFNAAVSGFCEAIDLG